METHSRAFHAERHTLGRVGWLRAAVLGANDGILSTGSIVVGVAASQSDKFQILMAGVAGLIAGAMSMAAGEYVSVSSQVDTERSDLAREAAELREQPQEELAELAAIYVARGVDRELANVVAEQMMRHDALGSHARDELGITEISTARPLQAAFTSGFTFSAGALLPLAAAVISPIHLTTWAVGGASLAVLAILGGVSAGIGGTPFFKPTARIVGWGLAAMTFTAAIGSAFGTTL